MARRPAPRLRERGPRLLRLRPPPRAVRRGHRVARRDDLRRSRDAQPRRARHAARPRGRAQGDGDQERQPYGLRHARGHGGHGRGDGVPRALQGRRPLPALARAARRPRARRRRRQGPGDPRGGRAAARAGARRRRAAARRGRRGRRLPHPRRGQRQSGGAARRPAGDLRGAPGRRARVRPRRAGRPGGRDPLARLGGQSLVVIGHQQGRDTREKIARNFGMPHPEGYRKALRLMELAAKFGKPIVTFIDTPGAYPGLGAEERGQAEAIARNLRRMASLPTPMIAVVTGEGGSGGALAIGMGNRVLMLEHAVYSVISPEGCAAILWGDAGKAPEAAEAMRTTAPELLRLGVIDGIVPEPVGGAHRDWEGAAASLRAALRDQLAELKGKPREALITERYEKFRRMGVFEEASVPTAAGDKPPR